MEGFSESLDTSRSNSSRTYFNRAISESNVNLLKSHAEDFKASLAINKRLVYSLLFKPNESTEDTFNDSFGHYQKLEGLIQEIKLLEEQNENVLEDRNRFQSKCLLNQQIHSEIKVRLDELVLDYNEKISDLEFQLLRQEKIIKELKALSLDMTDKLKLAKHSKYVIEAQIDPELLSEHCKVEDIQEVFKEKFGEFYSLKAEAEILKEFIEDVENKILKITILTKNPVNRKTFGEKFKAKVEEIGLKDNKNFENKVCATEGNDRSVSDMQAALQELKREIDDKSRELIKSRAKIHKKYLENQRSANDNLLACMRIKEMHSDYYQEDLTMEVHQDYESDLCNVIDAFELESIDEHELNNSLDSESD